MHQLCHVCDDFFGSHGPAAVCSACVSAFMPSAPGEDALILGDGTAMACRSHVPYAYPWVSMLHGLKFQDATPWAHHMGAWMAQAPGSRGWVASTDAWVPVPTTDSKRRERGHNPSELLVAGIRRSLPLAQGKPSLLQALRQLDGLESQHHLGQDGRRMAAQRRIVAGPDTAQVVGRRVVLVDDILTTGATLSAAAEVLLAAGAAQVKAWVFARTPHPSTHVSHRPGSP